jgi:hypothetical protein
MRTLIFGTSYIDTPEKLWLAERWLDLHTRLNPGADLVFVDSASSIAPPGPTIQLGDNIGHFWGLSGHDPKYGDGWGRAFCTGLQYAAAQSYDYVGVVESDLLCKVPIITLVEQMESQGKGVAAPVAHPHLFLEVGLMVAKVSTIQSLGLVQRYDWRTLGIMPEMRVEGIVKSDLSHMPNLRGTRLRDNAAKAASIHLPSLHYLTHATRAEFEEFLTCLTP